MKISPTVKQEIRDFSKMLHENNMVVQIGKDNKSVFVHKELGPTYCVSIVEPTNNSKIVKSCIVNPSGKGENPIDSLVNIMRNTPREGTFEFQNPQCWDAIEPAKKINYKI